MRCFCCTLFNVSAHLAVLAKYVPAWRRGPYYDSNDFYKTIRVQQILHPYFHVLNMYSQNFYVKIG